MSFSPRAAVRWSVVLAMGWLIGGCLSKLPFETIDQGFDSGYRERAALAVRTEEAWRVVWKHHRAPLQPMPERPFVDFNQEIVIAVFLGERPTGGFTVKIRRIEQRVHSVHVLVQETVPDPNSMVTQALTSPYHIVRVKRLELPVEFEFKSGYKRP